MNETARPTPEAALAALENRGILSPDVKAVLAEHHPDPYVQAAVWRVWVNAPGLLDSELARKLLNATMVRP